MEEKDNDIWSIVSSVINGTATQEEQNLFSLWLNENDENRRTFEIISNIRVQEKAEEPDSKLKTFAKVQREVLDIRYRKRIRMWQYAAAASILLLFSLGFLFKKLYRNDYGISEIEATCPRGVRSSIKLPDGSVVFLNSGSSIKYNADFKTNRELKLHGEAYFEVTKDHKHPFIVKAGEINVKVFGTRFNVRNFVGDSCIETTLVEGSVGLYRNNDKDYSNKFALNPNHQAIYNRRTSRIITKKVDAELSTIWTSGKYYFDNEPFFSISQKLERNFNVTIKIYSEELKRKSFSGLFDKNKSLYQILDVMKRYSNFSYINKNDSILIVPK